MSDLYEEVYNLCPGARKYSDYFVTTCIFHDDTNPSLKVSQRGYICWGCGKKGSLRGLRRILSGLPEKLTYTPQKGYKSPWRAWERTYGNLSQVCKKAYHVLDNFDAPRTYLRERKILSLRKKCKLGWLDGYFFFPIFRKDATIESAVVRATRGHTRYLTPPGHIGTLYVPDWRTILSAPTIYLVYGIIDALTLYNSGLPAITWSIGKNVPPTALAPFRFQKICIIPDSNEEMDAWTLAGSLGWRGSVKLLQYPEGLKDINDLAVAGYNIKEMLDV